MTKQHQPDDAKRGKKRKAEVFKKQPTGLRGEGDANHSNANSNKKKNATNYNNKSGSSKNTKSTTSPPKAKKLKLEPTVQINSNWEKLSKEIKKKSTSTASGNKAKHFTRRDTTPDSNNNNNDHARSSKGREANNTNTNTNNTSKRSNNMFDPSSFNDSHAFHDALLPTNPTDTDPTDFLVIHGAYNKESRTIWVVVVNAHGNLCLNSTSVLPPLLPEHAKKLRFLLPFELSSLSKEATQMEFPSLGKKVNALINNRFVVTKDGRDLLQLLMVEVSQKWRREFLKYPPLQDLDYYHLCKDFLSLSRYPLDATIVDQARILACVFPMHRKEWKDYLYLQKTKTSSPAPQNKQDQIQQVEAHPSAEQEDAIEGDYMEPIQPVFPPYPVLAPPPNLPKIKRSRFVSKSAPGPISRRFHTPGFRKRF